jgi:phosphohistidine phosphatase
MQSTTPPRGSGNGRSYGAISARNEDENCDDGSSWSSNESRSGCSEEGYHLTESRLWQNHRSVVVGMTLMLSFMSVVFTKSISVYSLKAKKYYASEHPPSVDVDGTSTSNGVKKVASSVCTCRNYDRFDDDDDMQECKTITLLRHAKSSWEESMFIDDFDRHLAPKGKRVARNVGQSLRDVHAVLPEVIFSSSSVRTKETLDTVLSEWMGKGSKKRRHKYKKSIRFDEMWYDLSDEGYLDTLITMLSDDSINRVMVVGHNPAMEMLLNDLAPLSDASLRKYSPGQLYQICLSGVTSWKQVAKDYHGQIVLKLPMER